MLKILGIVLSSSVISVLITALFTRTSHAESIALKYITEERAKWRARIKELMSVLSFTINEPSIDMAKIRSTSTCLKLNLNPNENEIIDSEIIKTINSLCNIPTYEKFKKLELQVSFLLKHDWDRAKNEAKITFSPVFIFPIFIIVIWSVFYIFLKGTEIYTLIQDTPYMSGSYNELAASLVMIIAPFSIYKVWGDKKNDRLKNEYNKKFQSEFQLRGLLGVSEAKHCILPSSITGKMMTLTENIRCEIKAGNIPPIFTASDFKSVGIEDKNNNISNYDKKNNGPQNSHTTVLVSIKIGKEIYYTFDEQLFD